MQSTFRIVLCVCLLAVAVTMAAFTLADLRKPDPSGALMLGAWEGSVAVFDRGDTAAPLRVTDIELKSLRATDRALVEHGIPVSSGEALQALLEDLGS